MNWLKIDDWKEILIITLGLIVVLLIIYNIIKLVFNNGGIKMKNFNMGKNIFPCSEHTQTLKEIKDTLVKMDTERSEAGKLNQILFKNILISQDALIEAFQKAQLGNGNLEKARKLISTSFDLKDNYLINQL